MVDLTSFPLYGFTKDDWSMFLVENRDRVFYHIEPIDFENDEYLFWNAEGRGVRLTLKRGKLIKMEEAENEITLNEAFARYSQALGAQIDLTGKPGEVWQRLQANVKPRTWLSRTLTNVIGGGCLLVVAIFVLIFLFGIVRAILAR